MATTQKQSSWCKKWRSMEETGAFVAIPWGQAYLPSSARTVRLEYCPYGPRFPLDAVRMASSVSQFAAAIAWDDDNECFLHVLNFRGRPIARKFYSVKFFHVNLLQCRNFPIYSTCKVGARLGQLYLSDSAGVVVDGGEALAPSCHVDHDWAIPWGGDHHTQRVVGTRQGLRVSWGEGLKEGESKVDKL